MPGLCCRVAQRQHGAAQEVQHRPAVLIRRGDPECRQAGRRPARAVLILPERHYLGAGPQRVAKPGQAAECQPPVEQVRLHVLRHDGGLADSDVPDEAGLCQRITAGYQPAQVLIEHQREPVAGDGLMGRGQAGSERHRGRASESLPHRQLVEIRARAGLRQHAAPSI